MIVHLLNSSHVKKQQTLTANGKFVGCTWKCEC